MSLNRPSAVITIDGRKLTSAEAGLAHLRIRLSTTSHDCAEMLFWPRTKFATAAIGATVAIAAGRKDQEEDILTGEVTAATQTPAGFAVTAMATTAQLSRTRKSQTYVSQTVADIVRDLAGPVSVDQVEGDLQLEAYSVDTRRNVWGHLLDLAMLTGAELGSSPSGGLRFVPVPSGPSTRTFRYGADVLHWSIAAAKPFEPLEAAAHGAASEAGTDKWHWLVRDPIGEGAKPSRVVGAFHAREAADQLTTALQGKASRSGVRGSLRIVGEPKVRAGEVVDIGDFPGNDPGPLHVLEVRHSLDAAGYLTSLTVEGAGA